MTVFSLDEPDDAFFTRQRTIVMTDRGHELWLMKPAKHDKARGAMTKWLILGHASRDPLLASSMAELVMIRGRPPLRSMGDSIAAMAGSWSAY